jgi:thiamine biosynthesis protein ThiC
MKKVFVLIKEPSMQYEGLRTSLGLLLEDHDVSMIVLGNEIENFDEAYSDNLGILVEMGGGHFSNHQTNVEKYQFQYADFDRICAMLKDADLVIPF